jgi:hypothetical protein
VTYWAKSIDTKMRKQRNGWPEAKKLCRLNQNDIEMAKRLGFGPDSLIRARPDPKQRWKLPVKDWIHELHFKRFGHAIGEKPFAATTVEDEYAVEAAPPYTIDDDDVPF